MRQLNLLLDPFESLVEDEVTDATRRLHDYDSLCTNLEQIAGQVINDALSKGDQILTSIESSLLNQQQSNNSQTNNSKTLIIQNHPNQVGGLSTNKKPALKLSHQYILKPLLENDIRALRELMFYEYTSYINHYFHLRDGDDLSSRMNLDNMIRYFHTVAPCFDHHIDKPNSYRYHDDDLPNLEKEISILRQLLPFTASYHGMATFSTSTHTTNHSTSNDDVVRDTKFSQEDNNSSIKSTSIKYNTLHHRIRTNIPSESYMVLSDLTANYHSPNIIDIKMGQYTYDPNATHDKKERERLKYTSQQEFGFRIVGMKIFDPHNLCLEHTKHSCNSLSEHKDDFRIFDKKYGRSLKNYESVKESIQLFFTKVSTVAKVDSSIDDVTRESKMNKNDISNMVIRTDVIEQVIESLNSIREIFESNQLLSFYSSSILITFDGKENEKTGDSSNGIVTVKMIDFAHVFRQPEGGSDQGYKHGLDTLLKMLKEILDKK